MRFVCVDWVCLMLILFYCAPRLCRRTSICRQLFCSRQFILCCEKCWFCYSCWWCEFYCVKIEHFVGFFSLIFNLCFFFRFFFYFCWRKLFSTIRPFASSRASRVIVDFVRRQLWHRRSLFFIIIFLIVWQFSLFFRLSSASFSFCHLLHATFCCYQFERLLHFKSLSRTLIESCFSSSCHLPL